MITRFDTLYKRVNVTDSRAEILASAEVCALSAWDSDVSPETVQSSLVRDSGVARDISVLRDSGVARIWLGLMSSNKSLRRWRLRETESV